MSQPSMSPVQACFLFADVVGGFLAKYIVKATVSAALMLSVALLMAAIFQGCSCSKVSTLPFLIERYRSTYLRGVVNCHSAGAFDVFTTVSRAVPLMQLFTGRG